MDLLQVQPTVPVMEHRDLQFNKIFCWWRWWWSEVVLYPEVQVVMDGGAGGGGQAGPGTTTEYNGTAEQYRWWCRWWMVMVLMDWCNWWFRNSYNKIQISIVE
jgi:hypothetical protein